MKKLATLFLLVSVGACGGSGGGGGGGVPGTTVQFQIPRGGTMPDFFALPFPTDLRLRSDGTLDLTGFPSGPRPDVLRGYLAAIEKTNGWATNGAAYFRFESAIDPGSLPADANASTRTDATVFLMDIDPTSPQRGMRMPVQLRYYAQATVFVPERVLAVLPVPGLTLRGKTRYAAVVTRAVRDSGGKMLGSPETLEQLKSKQASTNPDVENARGIYEPAFTELETHGVKREDVASLAVFTTQDPVGEMVRVRAFIHASVAQPEAVGVSCVAQSLYIKCTGEYSTPNFQAGTAPYQSAGGNLVFDASGNPQVQRTETLAFTLTLPKIAVPTSGFPITLAAHGTGGSRNSILGTNDTSDVLAQRGIAVIGIDQPLQGLRDDFCPTDPSQRESCEQLWTFNPANIPAARDNFRQGSIDNFQLLRLVKSLTIPAATAGTSTDVRFDPSKVFFFGHSQGGITGPAFLAVEPDVKGGVLSGSGGNLAIGLLLKTAPSDIKGTIEFLLGIEGKNELDIFHPIMTAVQTFVERADPLNYARAWVVEPLPGNTPKHVLITEGLGDSYTPNGTAEALGVASGGNPVTPVLANVPAFALTGRSALTPPVTGNVAGPGATTATVLLAQYAAAPDAATNPSKDGHFVVFWNTTARRQYGDFLGTLAETGAATFKP